MDNIVLQPKAAATKVDGKVVAAYLLFRQGFKAHRTLRFAGPDGARLNIDVDRNNIAIGMEIIHRDAVDLQVDSSQVPSVEHLVFDLFGFACQMAALQAQPDTEEKALLELGSSIIRDAVYAIPMLTHGTQRE